MEKRSRIKRLIFVTINLLISGFIAFIVTMFFAQGTIAENETDKTFVAPSFFSIFVIWGAGAVLALMLPFKNTENLFFLALIFMCGSLPVGFAIGAFWSL